MDEDYKKRLARAKLTRALTTKHDPIDTLVCNDTADMFCEELEEVGLVEVVSSDSGLSVVREKTPETPEIPERNGGYL